MLTIRKIAEECAFDIFNGNGTPESHVERAIHAGIKAWAQKQSAVENMEIIWVGVDAWKRVPMPTTAAASMMAAYSAMLNQAINELEDDEGP